MSQALLVMTYKMLFTKSSLNRGIKDLPTMTMVTQVLVDQNDPTFKILQN